MTNSQEVEGDDNPSFEIEYEGGSLRSGSHLEVSYSSSFTTMSPLLGTAAMNFIVAPENSKMRRAEGLGCR